MPRELGLSALFALTAEKKVSGVVWLVVSVELNGEERYGGGGLVGLVLGGELSTLKEWCRQLLHC
jgi:hypothetical protein